MAVFGIFVLFFTFGFVISILISIILNRKLNLGNLISIFVIVLSCLLISGNLSRSPQPLLSFGISVAVVLGCLLGNLLTDLPKRKRKNDENSDRPKLKNTKTIKIIDGIDLDVIEDEDRTETY